MTDTSAVADKAASTGASEPVADAAVSSSADEGRAEAAQSSEAAQTSPPAEVEAKPPAAEAKASSDGDAKASSDGDAKASSDGDAKASSDGDAKASSDGDAKASSDGDAKASSDGDAKASSDGDAKASSDGDAKASSDGDAKASSDGDAKASSDGDAKASSDGDAKASSDGDAKASSDGDAKASSDGDAKDEASGGSSDEAKASADGDAASGEGGDAPKKKRRRRRRKKKADGETAGGEAAASGASEATSKASEATSKARPRKKAKPQDRERLAFNVGDEIFGRVSKITKDALWIDVAAGKATGIFDRALLIEVPPKVGEQFIAKVISLSTRGGVLMLGRELPDTSEARTEIRDALQSEKPLSCWVSGVIKGGLEVDYKGVRAFAPASHVELRPGSDLGHMLGEKLDFVVTHYARKGRDVVVSRKAMMQEAYKEKRDEQIAKLKADMVVKAVVRHVLDWGAFVALTEYDDLEGVVHMSEASHNRSARLKDVFKTGKEIEVKILKIDDKGKLWLSHKATLDDPWSKVAETFPAGTIVKGKVMRLTDFGAFVELQPGIDGLCHVVDLSPTQVAHANEVVSEGQELEVLVAHVDAKAHRVVLHPAPPEDERELPRLNRINGGMTVQVVVSEIRDAGLGVRILGATGRHARGFIHAGQTGLPRGAELRKKFPLGTKLTVKVTDADSRRGEARLSIRALKEDAEKKAYRDYRKKVQRESSFGTFGDLLKGKL